MSNLECPPNDVLTRFCSGSLDAVIAELVAQHLEECPKCCEILSDLDQAGVSDFPVIRGEIEETPFEDESEYQRAVRLLNVQVAGAESSRFQREQIQERFHGYEIIEKLGEGGMGSVYLARHVHLGRLVALKIIRHYGQGQEVARFLREMKALGGLSHPHILSAWDAGVSEGVPYLVTEYIEGLDAGKILRQEGRLNVADACELIRQAALGLQELHSRGMVHRDLKPSNLMVSRSGVVYLLDFGLAKTRESAPVQEEDDSLSFVGQAVGTIDYMAPEQAQSPAEVDQRSDIYGLGATLFKLLTGLTPLNVAPTAGTLDKLAALSRDDRRLIGDHRTDLPQPLAMMIDSMLSQHRDHRPQEVGDCLQILERYAGGAELAYLARPSLSQKETLEFQAIGESTFQSERDQRISPTPSVSLVKWPTGRAVATVGFGLLALLAVTLLMTASGGLIRIQSFDPDVEIQILRSDRVVEDFEAGQLEEYSWYRSGEYEIRLANPDNDRIQIKNGKFRLKRNGKQTVVISRTTKVPENSPKQPRRPDADAIQWVLSQGGWVNVTPSSSAFWMADSNWVKDNKELRASTDKVTRILLHDLKDKITDDDLRNLQGLTKLVDLEFRSHLVQLDGTGLRFLSDSPLQRLSLAGTGSHLTLRGAETVATFSQLDFLRFDGLSGLNGKMLAALAPLKNLRHLNLFGCDLPHDALIALDQFPSLIDLTLSGNSPSAQTLKRLSSLPVLQTLRLDYTPIGDRDVEMLLEYPALRTVSLTHSRVSERRGKELSRQVPEWDIEVGSFDRAVMFRNGEIIQINRVPVSD
ncbi:MAG: protein kinase [Planctomycetaceae bacterium]|nr:protein kinase [Planctomycetaceae bacterium]